MGAGGFFHVFCIILVVTEFISPIFHYQGICVTTYTNVEGNDYSGFKVKRICVYPKKRLSLQSHNHRSEHWVIVKGQARVQLDDKFIEMGVSDHVYIPVKALHRMENIGDTMVEFVETQIGDYLGEDDIVRYEDDFGRK